MAAAVVAIHVPTYAIRAGGSHGTAYKVAESAITPGDLTQQGTAEYHVAAGGTGVRPNGVADLNYDAAAEDLDILTHDFAANDECIILTSGRVRVIAGAAAMTFGVAAMVGTTAGTDVEDLTATAANAGDTYKTTNLDLIMTEVRTTIGMNMTTTAKTVAGVIDLVL